MRLRIEQLAASLSKSLQPIYFISGEEPLQLGEAADEIRLAVRKAGYDNREVISIDSGNEWQRLTDEASSLSIFSDKKLIELRLPSAKPGQEGGKTLLNYCQRLPEDTLLLIIASGKLESASQKSQWFQALDKAGATLQVWPLQGKDLLDWLQRRAQKRGLQIDDNALKSLASRIEGNLLAAAQEIEKLYILHGHARIDKTLLEAQVADSARFDVFKLTEALLSGKANRSLKILQSLQAGAIADAVVLWAISRELRLLLSLKAGMAAGGQPDSLLKQHNVWDNRKQQLLDALPRLSIRSLQQMLLQCAQADRQIKGQASGDSWETLFAICLSICGKQIKALDKAERLHA